MTTISINNNEVKVVYSKIYNFPKEEEDFNQFETDELLSVLHFTGFRLPLKMEHVFDPKASSRKILIHRCYFCNRKVRYMTIISTRNINKIVCDNCKTRPKNHCLIRHSYSNVVREIYPTKNKLIYTYNITYSLDEYYQKYWYKNVLFQHANTNLVADIKNVIIYYAFLLLHKYI